MKRAKKVEQIMKIRKVFNSTAIGIFILLVILLFLDLGLDIF